MRTYFKVFSDKILNGSCVSLEETGCWIKLLALNSVGQYHDSGEIKMTSKIGLVDEQIAALLKISVKEWLMWRDVFIKGERITVNEKNVIKIVNWAEYQTEYGRQKPYREIADINKEIDSIYRDKRLEIREYRVYSLNKVTKKSYSSVISIFLTWNAAQIIAHRQLTPEMYRSIKQTLESYNEEEIVKAVENYGKILREKQYFWSFKFTLSDFLGRKKDYIAKFKDWDTAHTNYLRDDPAEKDDETWRVR